MNAQQAQAISDVVAAVFESLTDSQIHEMIVAPYADAVRAKPALAA